MTTPDPPERLRVSPFHDVPDLRPPTRLSRHTSPLSTPTPESRLTQSQVVGVEVIVINPHKSRLSRASGYTGVAAANGHVATIVVR